MLNPRNVLDDLITLAACRGSDAVTTMSGQSAPDGLAPMAAISDPGFGSSSTALARPFSPVGAWGRFATQILTPLATPFAAGTVDPARPIESAASRPSFMDAPLAAWIAPGADDAGANPSERSAVAQAWMTRGASEEPGATGSAAPDKSGFSKKALASTQPQVIDFTSGPQGVFGSHTSFTFSLPSFLYQHYEFGIGASFAGFGLHAGASITGGVKGSVALSLGEFTPNYPVTIDPGVAPFVQDGQVFSIDPSLVSTNDAQFSLSLPQANASLDFGLQASAGVTLSFPSLRIGVTLPFVGFVGYTLSIPSQSVGFNAGNIYKLPSNSTISIPGDGTITLSQLQSKVVNSTPQSAYGGLPTLEMSGNTDPFFVANTDLVSILAQEAPDPFAALQGSESFYGLAGISYKLLSLPLSGALWLNEDVTITPIGITETVTDTLTGQTQSGPLGSRFNFTAPSSGSGIIPFSVTFGLDFSVHTTLELDGDVKMTLEGPSVSASILGVSGGVGPLGNFNLLDISGELFQLYSNTFNETLTTTAKVDVQTFASPVTKKVNGPSGPVSLTKPGTDLLVTAKGTVTGGAYGVETGTLSAAVVTDYGLITATGNGVDLQEGGTVRVQSGGRITAAGASPGAGILVMGNTIDAVVNAGAITGFAQGVNMIGGSLKNETGGRITATSVGVTIANAAATIVNDGYIHAATAVSLTLGGGLYNAQSGTITGATYGVNAQGVVSVENQCTLTGGVSAVRAIAGGTVTNLAGAYMHGGVNGVILNGGIGSNLTVANGAGGVISGGNVGVSLAAAYATLVNYGTVSGSQAAIEIYGTLNNTLVLGPDAKLLGGVRFSDAFNTVSLTAGGGDVGTLDLDGLTLTVQGHALPFQNGRLTIGAGAAWNIKGNFEGDVVSGLNAADQLDDTAIAYSVGERVVVNPLTDVLSIRAAGNPTQSLGTIQLSGTLNYAPIVTAGASGGVNIAFSEQKLTTVSANNGEVYIAPTSFFAPEVTVAAGVLVSANYYGSHVQNYAVLAAKERATLTNYGTVSNSYGSAMVLRGGGLVNNEAGATITGGLGVDLRAITPDPTDTVSLVNAGVITATGNGVYINTPGTVTNTGQIASTGLNGVQFNYDVAGSVFNQGTITAARSAVRMFDGGAVYNGASGLLTTHGAFFFGVEISNAYGKVINLGTISSPSGVGVYLTDGGLVVNESGAITGQTAGVKIAGAAGNIANAAYISGVRLANGGTIINGASGVIGAVGGYGVNFYNRAGPIAAYLHNMGRVGGVLAFGGDTIVNDGTIDGVGVVAGPSGGVTVVNAGAIAGSGGVAVRFSASNDRLIAEAGSHFSGALQGGGGVLELGGVGATAITGLGGAGQSSGAIAASFSGFGQYVIDAGMTVTLLGPTMIAQGQTLTDNGSLAIGAGATLRADGLVAIGGYLGLGGAILGLSGADAPGGAGGLGVEMSAAGAITLSGSIRGGAGRNGYRANYHTQGGAGGDGVAGGSSATITNNSGLIAGGAGGSSAYYFGPGGGGGGGCGVNIGAGMVANNGGTIAGGAGGAGVGYYDLGGSGGSGGAGLSLAGGGTVVNVGGLIYGGAGGAGGAGGYFGGAGGAGGAGVVLAAGGEVINTAGTIVGGAGGGGGSGGYGGGPGGARGDGVDLMAGGVVINGSGAGTTALIWGATGLYAGASGAATVINFGTIEGADGTAVRFNSAGDRLIVEAGSTWLGDVSGGGGALELAGGTGTITGLGGAGTLSGAEAMTFGGFGSYVIDAGGRWTLAGAATLGANQTLTNAGTLTGNLTLGSASDRLIVDAGSVVNGVVGGGGGVLELAGGAGTITGLGATGTLSGAAALTFSGFVSYAVDAGAAWLLKGKNTLSSSGTISVGGALTLTGALTGGGAISGAAGSKIVFKKVYIAGGAVTSAGLVTISGKGNTFDGSAAPMTSQATITIANAGALTIKGALANSGTILLAGQKATTSLVVDSAGATLSGGGSVFLEASALNSIVGAKATAILTNAGDRISGSGQIGAGKLILVNQAAGVIAQMGALAMTIDTGTKAVSNAGTIEATGSGGLTVASAVANAGLLEALGGDLTLNGAVTGSGSAVINAATLSAASTFSENVTFSGTTGELELAKSQGYAGVISGFATTGSTALDLRDIGFVSGSEATFSGTAAGGVLTVTDGKHTAKIAFTGDYLGSSWVASSDGAGGVIVVDPAPPPAPSSPARPSPPAFISAMAGMGAGGASLRWAIAEGWREPSPMMAAPRLQIY